MSSINGFPPHAAMYQAFGDFDNDKPRHNPLDKTAGDDAEVFDPDTQSWQPTRASDNGDPVNLGDPYREAIDFEISSDTMSGSQRA